MKTKNLKIGFANWHDFDENVQFFQTTDQDLLRSAIQEAETLKEYFDNLETFKEESVAKLGISGIKALCTIFSTREDIIALAALLPIIDGQKNKKSAEKLRKLVSEKIVSLIKIKTIVEVMNGCHCFVAHLITSIMEVPGYKKIGFTVAKNLLAARVLLDSEPIRMKDVKNILECLTPLFQELEKAIESKRPKSWYSMCASQLVEVFEAMSKFLGIDVESSAPEVTQSEKLETASVSAEA